MSMSTSMPHVRTTSSPSEGLRQRAEPRRSETQHSEAAGTAVVAVTGATGFVGHAVCSALARQGVPVRALVRRPDATSGLPATASVVLGLLEDDASLASLVEGAGTIVHAAGLVSARRPEDFRRVNVEGTKRLLAAVRTSARPARILLVSSLAARAPSLSAYAASKRAAEAAVADAGVEFCIVRPPAIYGPRDKATLPLFRQLAHGLLVAPRLRGARFSLLHVEDLADLLRRLAVIPRWAGDKLEPDDGRDGGYGWSDIAAIAQAHLGRPVRCVRVPRSVAWSAALLDEALAAARGRAPRLSRGKLGELWYPDWVCRRAAATASPGWAARIGFAEGFGSTLAWYRRHGWL
jgi:uncharacterized protein YbjT (DUF2867 family)